jgi:hypothetical protein
MTCTQEYHQSLKYNPIAWQLHTVPPVGHDRRPIIDAGEDWLEYANCVRCHSTLARKTEIHLRGAQ